MSSGYIIWCLYWNTEGRQKNTWQIFYHEYIWWHWERYTKIQMLSGVFIWDKKSRTIATRYLVLIFDKLIAELFYPKRAENRATTQVATTFVSEAAAMIVMELTDTRKATSIFPPVSRGSTVCWKLLKIWSRMSLGKSLTIVYRRVVSKYLKNRLQKPSALYLIMPRPKHCLASKINWVEVTRLS